MKSSLDKYGQYTKDIFNKLDFKFNAGKKILDLGCGPGTDSKVFRDIYKLKVFAIDIYRHDNLKEIKGIKFNKAGIYKIPYPDNFFDYVFLHDVLHHIDEAGQRYKKHSAGLDEVYRVTKKNGSIIIVEGNRYNPLFFPHMVKMHKHNHWKQSYFLKILKGKYDDVDFKFFECHFYPKSILFLGKLYEKFMEKISPKAFLAYNAAIIRKK